mmetsp:Transcript_13585/g.38917  ORF Transcript_13585/g.38917 Transcript_13585/m.38917 type:complete len:207 (+) Transcript_13585:780-1400(+)
MLFNEFLEWDGHAFLNHHGVLHVTRNSKQLRASVVFVSKGCEPRGTTSQDSWRHSDGFDVGNGGWTTKNTHPGGERGLEAWLSLPTLETFNQGSFFTTNVSTRSTVEIDIEIVPGATRILSDQPGLVRFVNSLIQHHCLVEVFATDVDVCGAGTHGVSGHQASFDQLVRIFSHNLAVLASSWFGFVSVDNQERGTAISRLRHEAPL